MDTGNRKDYWEYRGKQAYTYKGETFYTVTPIPYYYRRRELLLQLMTPLLADTEVVHICDFGCGDGYYLKHFSSICESKQWYGVDLSQTMIDRAGENCPGAVLQVSADGILFDLQFDLIYSVAVFAHIPDDVKIQELFANISTRLKPQGCFVLFEQTGPKRHTGNTWCRRNTDDYMDYAQKCGLSPVNRQLIVFPLHRRFEKLAGYILCTGGNGTERCIKANRSAFFRLLSSAAMALSGPSLRADEGTLEGNSFYVFKKVP